jgi:hypothetical protein
MSATATLPAETTQAPSPLQASGPSLQTGYLVDTERFEHLWRVALAFSKSNLVPDTFKNRPEDCFVAAQLSLRLNCDLFMLLQNIYIVHGKPGFEAKLSIALLNASGKIEGTIRYRFDGDGDAYGCTAYVADTHTGELVEGPKVDMAMVNGEGWNKSKGGQPSKWQTMPDQMFRYRAATFLIRAHYPEVMMGMQTREEIEDTTIDAEPPKQIANLDALTDKLEGETVDPEAATDAPADDPPTPEDPRPEYLDALAAATTLSGVDQVRRDWRGRWMSAEDMSWAKVKAEERKGHLRPKEEPDGEARG